MHACPTSWRRIRGRLQGHRLHWHRARTHTATWHWRQQRRGLPRPRGSRRRPLWPTRCWRPLRIHLHRRRVLGLGRLRFRAMPRSSRTRRSFSRRLPRAYLLHQHGVGFRSRRVSWAEAVVRIPPGLVMFTPTAPLFPNPFAVLRHPGGLGQALHA